MSDSTLGLGPAGRVTLNDILDCLDAEPCPYPDCEGVLRPGEYKDTAAVVCERCEVPAARVWGEES